MFEVKVFFCLANANLKRILPMTLRIDLTGSMVLLTADKISVICKPLLDLNISGFQYMRRYVDGSRIIFSNIPELIQYFYEECHYPVSWYHNDKPISIYKSGWELDPIRLLYSTDAEKLISQDFNRLFDIRQGVTYLQRQADFLDVFIFLSNDHSIYKYSQKFFRHFMFYFKEQAHQLLKKYAKDRIKVPIRNEPENDQWMFLENQCLKSMSVKRYYFNNLTAEQYLTQKEKECLHWCIEGKTAQEIAMILGTSRKTTENHIQKIKEKLDCYKQSRLSAMAIQQGIYPL